MQLESGWEGGTQFPLGVVTNKQYGSQHLLSTYFREALAEQRTSVPWPPPGPCVLGTWSPGHIPALAPEPTGPARCHCSCLFVPSVTVPWGHRL